ncbi:hypothetical protein FRC04_010986 [Tulasnella sp. 424]|nr:hypothetical protein FRC04_010986 [Tulasnella sp. 424]
MATAEQHAQNGSSTPIAVNSAASNPQSNKDDTTGSMHRNDSPPAFLDLADSQRIEQKRAEHERLRSHHRRMFEEQMRALEAQQLAEERALLSGDALSAAINNANASVAASLSAAGYATPGNGYNGSNGLVAGLGFPNGVALSAPTTPPSGAGGVGGNGMSLSPVAGDQVSNFNGTTGAVSGLGLGSANPSGLANLDGTSSPYGAPGVIGSSNAAKRKSVNITASPASANPVGGLSAYGGANTTGPSSITAFSNSPLTQLGGGVFGGGNAAGAKSMPASRRGSSGSGNGVTPGLGGGDDLVAGLAQLGIGPGASSLLNANPSGLGSAGMGGENLTRAGTMPGAVGSNSAFGSGDAYLWDEGLDREMQNSLRQLPPGTASAIDDTRTHQFPPGMRQNNPLSSDPFATRKSSVASVALDLAAPHHSSNSPRGASYLLNLHHNQQLGHGADWPLFTGSKNNLGAIGSGGAMTAGNGTPVMAGTPVLGPTHLLGDGSPNGVGRIGTPNGVSNTAANRLSVHSATGTPHMNTGVGLTTTFTPVEGRGGSPATATNPALSLSAVDPANYMNMGGARSVPSTPLSTLPPSQAALLGAAVGGAVGMMKSAVDVPSPYPEFSAGYSTPGAPSVTTGTTVTQRTAGSALATPASAYDPIAFGSIAGNSEDGHQYQGGGYPGEYDQGYMGYPQGGVYNGLPVGAQGEFVGRGRGGLDAGSLNGSRPGTASAGMLGGARMGGGGARIASVSGMSSASGDAAHPKMGGLHGPKHKRSDLDREYNRFNGTQLEDLQHDIATMCKDQHGCRYLQKKLEEGVPEHRDMIFRETYPHFAELMTDPFGNYLCQKLLEYSTDEQRDQICRSVGKDLVNISLNMHGTRAVQKMIDFLSTSRQIHSIIVSLGMHVVTLIKDLNGNHVVQKCLNKLSPEDNQFIYNAVATHCVEVATHRHGCCVLQRCVDHASDAQRIQLVTEITYHALTLVQDPYGNYVVQYILDLNDNRFSDAVIRQFLGNVCALSVQKFSSNVIEKCIRVAEHNTRKMLIEELLNRTRLEKLLRDSFGNYCVQTALDYAEPNQRAVLVEYIRPILPLIRNTPYGKRIQSKLQREQVEASHVQHYGVPNYHANQAALLALTANGLNGVNQGRHLHQQSLHHASQLVDPYANQGSLYSHGLPAGLHGQTHMHGVPPQTLDAVYGSHQALQRTGGGASLINNAAAFGGIQAYSTPVGGNFNVSLPLGNGIQDHYGRSNYGYGA